MTYHQPRNAARYVLQRITAKPLCEAGTGCELPAAFRAISPSFIGKQMCQRHAEQWAKRHNLEMPK